MEFITVACEGNVALNAMPNPFLLNEICLHQLQDVDFANTNQATSNLLTTVKFVEVNRYTVFS